MSDYICAECGAGFPQRSGRVRIHNPHWFGDPEDANSTLEKWTIKFNNMFTNAFKSAYYVECPECGHRVGGD